MAGVKGKGGKKGRSGRKSKAEEQDLAHVLKLAVSSSERVELFRQLKTEAMGGSIDAKKLLLAYIYGTPTAHHSVTGTQEIRVVYGDGDNASIDG